MFQRITLRFQSIKALRKKKKELNHYYGSTKDKEFKRLCKKLDNIDREINRKEQKKHRKEKRKKQNNNSNSTYGVHREHGWYLRNDD